MSIFRDCNTPNAYRHAFKTQSILPRTVIQWAFKNFEWIDVSIPTGTTPGIYNGTLRVTQEGTVLETLNIAFNEKVISYLSQIESYFEKHGWKHG